MKQMHIVAVLVVMTLLLTVVNSYITFDTRSKVNAIIAGADLSGGEVAASTEYTGSALVKGQDSAKVMIVEFSDYQCPYCRRFAQNTYPSLQKEFIDSGKARFAYRDFPLGFHEFAQKASEAAKCSKEQNKFWEYHEKIFSVSSDSALDVASLKKDAADLGLDTAKFNDCLDSGNMAAEVKKDQQDGAAAGVTGTPAFMVNDILVTGACPIQTFRDAINAELAGKQWSVTNCNVKAS
jgi:protein-disulfide isomerase